VPTSATSVCVCVAEARTIFSQFPMFGTKGCAGFFLLFSAAAKHAFESARANLQPEEKFSCATAFIFLAGARPLLRCKSEGADNENRAEWAPSNKFILSYRIIFADGVERAYFLFCRQRRVLTGLTQI
jgi:hypothetical protein